MFNSKSRFLSPDVSGGEVKQMSKSLLVGASAKRRQQTFKFLADENISNLNNSGQYSINPGS